MHILQQEPNLIIIYNTNLVLQLPKEDAKAISGSFSFERCNCINFMFTTPLCGQWSMILELIQSLISLKPVLGLIDLCPWYGPIMFHLWRSCSTRWHVVLTYYESHFKHMRYRKFYYQTKSIFYWNIPTVFHTFCASIQWTITIFKPWQLAM